MTLQNYCNCIRYNSGIVEKWYKGCMFLGVNTDTNRGVRCYDTAFSTLTQNKFYIEKGNVAKC